MLLHLLWLVVRSSHQTSRTWSSSCIPCSRPSACIKNLESGLCWAVFITGCVCETALVQSTAPSSDLISRVLHSCPALIIWGNESQTGPSDLLGGEDDAQPCTYSLIYLCRGRGGWLGAECCPCGCSGGAVPQPGCLQCLLGWQGQCAGWAPVCAGWAPVPLSFLAHDRKLLLLSPPGH